MESDFNMTGQLMITPRLDGRPADGATNAGRPALRTVVSSVKSDSHTWNLIYIELVLRELGHEVVNLGPCVPEHLLVQECASLQPDLVVLSTVNGHGLRDGYDAAGALRADPCLATVPLAIGGRLTVSDTVDADAVAGLRDAGFDAVFADGDIDAFRVFVGTVAARTTG